MTALRWASLIADPDGEIQNDKLRNLAGIVLGVLGGLLAIGLAAWSATGHTVEDTTLVGWVITALVAPVTVGKTLDGLANLRAAKNAAPPAGDP